MLTSLTFSEGTNPGSKAAFLDFLWNDGPLDMDPEFGTGGLLVLPMFNGTQASIWTSNKSDPALSPNPIVRSILDYNTGILRHSQNDQFRYGVRCVLNNNP